MKIRQNSNEMAAYCLISKMAAAAMLDIAIALLFRISSKRACCFLPVFQISSKSVNKWPSYSIFGKSKMAAAAILEKFKFEFFGNGHDPCRQGHQWFKLH
mgnify:CR=1 FL=1